ncbi:MAG: elongation factor P maturation arginine rhamnosyltransferase EarP [Gammaproteobacteria bacterium]|nr:elongation factor P maturation arginine rhamnosyltransferase EarP [Gammaproteobacteria bacterium]MBU0786348.1 elongation factor P maturation arginine rhamnosyltransferase EarP [Gammaproteobacteria bacterium]MBU0814432.1 elongation factor P maturation arginine rhamnosyltransferase EarP [Gammaproteobacteria bacterium]MBU1786725.1 elongation factor P maturation arginine rhamnosyltransferase EarP [Gammaproteobacteria bacterium]
MTVALTTSSSPGLQWDIFCKVVDNFGDIGVSWRLCADLASRGQQVRLWVDDASALAWMAPQGCPEVTVMPWPHDYAKVTPGDVVLETFGCDIAPDYIAGMQETARATGKKIPWINLEYLSAEPYVERSHGLPSPVMSGPGTGLTRHFFYPGFTPRTGGLLREPDLLARQNRFDRQAWLAQQGLALREDERLISLFCYEPPALPELLTQLAAQPQPVRLLVTSGRATQAMHTAVDDKNRLQPSWNNRESLSISYLPVFSQHDFDHLLWAADMNFVRGEDSLVRAIWAGKPFVWQIYPQHDTAHHDKLEALLETVEAPASLRRFHRSWNSVSAEALETLDLAGWTEAARQARTRLLVQRDLCSQLLEFVGSIRTWDGLPLKKR